MGWGFAIIVDKTDTEKTLNALEKAGAQPDQIGKVIANENKIVIQHEKKKLVLA